jgi:hypothetical protein
MRLLQLRAHEGCQPPVDLQSQNETRINCYLVEPCMARQQWRHLPRGARSKPDNGQVREMRMADRNVRRQRILEWRSQRARALRALPVAGAALSLLLAACSGGESSAVISGATATVGVTQGSSTEPAASTPVQPGPEATPSLTPNDSGDSSGEAGGQYSIVGVWLTQECKGSVAHLSFNSAFDSQRVSRVEFLSDGTMIADQMVYEYKPLGQTRMMVSGAASATIVYEVRQEGNTLQLRDGSASCTFRRS